ncbi:MAG: uracil-DNA glycosylase [Anaerolineae bacterium]|nr:uracil-DNA glycosylase [Anaerolineae bacterium]
MVNNREQALQDIHAQVRSCTQCPLYVGRTHAVPGDGPVNATLMFIGEAPGFHEDQQGIPFVGAAGRFLNELLQKAGIDRGTVYITNVIKCRPPGNRDPLIEEVNVCTPFLDQQIEIISPQVIVTLGRHSMNRAFPDEKISIVHGQPRKVNERVYFPMYHPAAALHQPSLRSTVEADFDRLRALLDGKLTPEDFTPPPEVEQLSLF